jgi:hypothetical protein
MSQTITKFSEFKKADEEISDNFGPTCPGVQEFIDSLEELSLDKRQKQIVIDEFLVLRAIINLCDKGLVFEAIDLALLNFGGPNAKQGQGCTKGYNEIKS